MELNTSTVIAVQLELPKSIGWAVTTDGQSWHGNSLGALAQCIADKEFGSATLSLTLLLPLELGQDPEIATKE